MRSVVELLATVVDGPLAEGASVRHERVALFSSVDEAARWARGPGAPGALWYVGLAGRMDCAWAPDEVVFDQHGRIVEDWRGEPEPWAGRRPEDCAFDVGDAVLCVHDGRLAVGTVERRPPGPGFAAGMDRSDDTYLIVFPDGGHEHAPEYRLRRPTADAELAGAAARP